MTTTANLHVKAQRVLVSARADLSSEKAAQADLAAVLLARLPGVSVEREVRLSSHDVVDIMVDGSVAVEVKLRGQPKASIYRQLKRYAAHDRVKSLILVSNIAMGLPPEIEGKPTGFVSLGRSWL